ncbi:methyltransferase family protein [Extibacter sp. GGCC_0201]|uniref:methyltransferase family protein n=1 Tax=Extibacter sp. GGCC_0201 TaxID=2731209 RepID=UPI001AA1D28F|nr:isoprenylcysteine carboxylmethyltransferase family protein [Extibacter sp. GGCC_0201]MBO1722209.1 isoprenylcysteine carboxylmethyltransferase family protein [Extibacter sp. GGCC_0201]
MAKLALQAVTKLISGFVLIGLLLFLPAGSISYLGAWRFIALLFVPMLFVGGVLMIRAPNLLRKRLNDKEPEMEQKIVIVLSGLEFIICFIVAGLDYRFGWTSLPKWLIGIFCVAFLISYGIYAEVIRENAYLSRTVEIQENQQVISTGLYRFVRHPMYFSVVLMFWAMPLVLESLPAFIVMVPFPLLLVKRIRNEEKVLEEGLSGYKDYENRVKYRLIPFVW